jgi:hypothetical protein
LLPDATLASPAPYATQVTVSEWPVSASAFVFFLRSHTSTTLDSPEQTRKREPLVKQSACTHL